MGTSSNRRSPSNLRWRTVAAAYGGSPRPRALGELFLAADADGWAESLASPVCGAYARHAANAWDRLPSLMDDSATVGSAIRQVVDEARLDALEEDQYAEAGLLPALVERALTRTLVGAIHEAGTSVSESTPLEAKSQWLEGRAGPESVLVGFLAESVKAVTLHLVMRDGPQLVERLGGSAAVNEFAVELSDLAGEMSKVAAVGLTSGFTQRDWATAVHESWSATRVLSHSATSVHGTSAPHRTRKGRQS